MYYYLFENPNDTRKADLKAQIRSKLHNQVSASEQADIILVLGGDGTMLDAIHKLHHYNKPFFGINCGRFGFLLNDIDDVNKIPTGWEQLETITEPFITGIFTNNKGEQETAYAINDILLGNDFTTWSTFTLSKEGKSLPPITGSSILLSSAIGSSGSWANNFGQPIPIGTNSIGVMGISTRPFRDKMLQGNSVHTISIDSPRDPVDAWIDGKYKSIKNIQEVSFSSTEETYSLLFLKNGTYTSFAEKSHNLFTQKFEKAF